MESTLRREDFPLLARTIEGRTLNYLDSAATTLKPQAVLEAMNAYYTQVGANIHRAKHALSEEASELYERARRKVAQLIGAPPSEVVFTSGATHAINLVALGLRFRPGDNVVTTQQEHHSNLLPWYERAEVRLVPVDRDGRVDPHRLEALIDARTRLVALSHASNATGAIHPIAELCERAKSRGAWVLVDGAQSVPHLFPTVKELGCDFLAFSGHKMLGPTGVGVLWGRAERLEALEVALRGGGVVNHVTLEGYELKRGPQRFEPGTPNIAGVIGLGAAVDYLQRAGLQAIRDYGHVLAAHMWERLRDLPGTLALGPDRAAERLPLVSLAISSQVLHADALAVLLSDTKQIMVRSGHHCCHPYFDVVAPAGALRVSAYCYNGLQEIDAVAEALRTALRRLNP